MSNQSNEVKMFHIKNEARDLVTVFDTETTGKSDFKASYNAPQQPNLVQLGYKVYEPNTKEVVFEIGHLVNSTVLDGWSGIEEGAQNVHGISEEMIREYGWHPSDSISLFQRWLNRSRLAVAHNKSFDIMIMQCAAFRAGWNPDLFADMATFCTMMTTTNICKIPNAKGYGNKWPTLAEALKFFTGRDIDGAHNALVDVNACGDIFWMLHKRELCDVRRLVHGYGV